LFMQKSKTGIRLADILVASMRLVDLLVAIMAI